MITVKRIYNSKTLDEKRKVTKIFTMKRSTTNITFKILKKAFYKTIHFKKITKTPGIKVLRTNLNKNAELMSKENVLKNGKYLVENLQIRRNRRFFD